MQKLFEEHLSQNTAKAKETIKNKALSKVCLAAIRFLERQKDYKADKEKGKLIYSLVSQTPESCEHHLEQTLLMIQNKQIISQN